MSQFLRTALFPIFLILLAHFLTQVRTDWPVADGMLVGTDSYTRMTRVIELTDGEGWYDRTIARSNAPHGDELHWTRPLDVLIVVGAIPFAAVLEWRDALFYSGAFVSPILHLATLFVLLWACAPVFPAYGRVYVGIIFAAQFFVSHQFALGRPDHHGLLALLLTGMTGCMLRLLKPGAPLRLSVAAAVMGGVGIWVGVEGLFAAGLVMAMLWLAWIWRGEAFVRHGCCYAATLVLTVGVALILEYPPSQWPVPRYDSISLVHFYLLALTAVFWFLVMALPKTSTRQDRILITIAFAVAYMTLFWLAFPKFFAGPLVDMNERVYREWFLNNQEIQGLVNYLRVGQATHIVILHFGTAIIGGLYLIHIIRTSRDEERWRWVFLTLGFALCFALSLGQIRWTGHLQLFAVYPVVGLILSLLDAVTRRTTGIWTPVARAFTVLAVTIGPPLLGMLFLADGPTANGKPGTGGAQVAQCRSKDLAGFLNENFQDGPALTVMTYNGFGPELIYRTRHKVVTTPYHRNAAGILDGFDFMRGNDLAAVRRIAARRSIDLVAICPGHGEAGIYQRPQDGDSFHKNLADGQIPNWLERVDTSGSQARAFQLFRVLRQ